MTLGFLFWLLMILWVLFGVYWKWPASGTNDARSFGPVGGTVLLFVLLFLLGWKTFGFIVSG